MVIAAKLYQALNARFARPRDEGRHPLGLCGPPECSSIVFNADMPDVVAGAEDHRIEAPELFLVKSATRVVAQQHRIARHASALPGWLARAQGDGRALCRQPFSQVTANHAGAADDQYIHACPLLFGSPARTAIVPTVDAPRS